MAKAWSMLTAMRLLLLVLIFFLPLFLFPITLDPLEIGKQTLFVVLTSACALCWIASMLFERRVGIKRGWANLLPLFFLFAFVIPSMDSIAPYLSWVGAHRQEYTSVLTVVTFVILFYLAANTIQGQKQQKQLYLVLVIGVCIAVLFSLLQIMGIPIFSSVSTSLTFNTVGTFSSFLTLLIVLDVFFLAAELFRHGSHSLFYDGVIGIFERILAIFATCVTLLFLLLVDDPSLWLLWCSAFAIVFILVLCRAKDIKHHRRLVFPSVLFFIGLAFWFILPGWPLVSLPLEVTPNTASSVWVASQTLAAHVSGWGSGPGTYLFDYTRFHDASLNETDFWDTRFDRASSFVLTLVPTIGVFGVTLLGLFVVLLFLLAIRHALAPRSRETWREIFLYGVPWVTLVISAFVLSWNMTLVVFFGLFSGLFASRTMGDTRSLSFRQSPFVRVSLLSVFVVLILLTLVVVFFAAGRYVGESTFTRAVRLNREGQNPERVISLLDRATTINPYHDTYYRNLGEALLLRVNETLTGLDSIDMLSAESAQYLQSMVAASVNATARATELSPNNVLNWLSRGFIYRELIPLLDDAGTFAVFSYERSIELEPLNPMNWTELGRTYLVLAQQARPLTVSEDAEVAQEAQTQLVSWFAAAEDAFEKAIELKSNYAPAHFQVAVSYAQQDRLDEAIVKMERVAQYNPLDAGVFFQLGMWYMQRHDDGDVDRAKTSFVSAIALAPDYVNAHWFLASIYEAQGDLASAAREVETVLELDPGNEIAEARLVRLLSGQIEDALPEAIEEE